MYLSKDMWYKKVQVFLGLIKREFNSCHRCQARVNREKWASLPSFYTPLPRLRERGFTRETLIFRNIIICTNQLFVKIVTLRWGEGGFSLTSQFSDSP